MKSVIVKLTSRFWIISINISIYCRNGQWQQNLKNVTGSGVGLVKGGAIIAGASIGIGVEEGIRRTFLGSPECQRKLQTIISSITTLTTN